MLDKGLRGHALLANQRSATRQQMRAPHLHAHHAFRSPAPTRSTPSQLHPVVPPAAAAYTDSPQFAQQQQQQQGPGTPIAGMPPLDIPRAPPGAAAPRAHVYQGGLATLVAEVQAAEEQLQQMFQPGQIMPKASVVNKLRDSISEMKGRLSALVADTEEEQQRGRRQATQAEREALAKAKMMLMGVPLARVEAAQVGTSSPLQAGSVGYEIAYLEAENAQLRKQAKALLVRQKLLEDIAAELGIKRRNRTTTF